MKVGVLLLEHYKERAHPRRTKLSKSYFDGEPQVGLKMILDVLEREAGVAEVGYCSLADINDYDVVLVTLISILDVMNLIFTFSKRGATARDFKPTIIVGGPTVDNVKTFEDYGDVFVLGRGEETILEVWRELEAGRSKTEIKPSEFYHVRGYPFESKMMRSATEFYPHKIGRYQERMLGCPNKCFFCHYSFTKPYIESGGYRDTNIYGAVEESTFHDLTLSDSIHKVVGIDGWSERLRLAVNKKITNEDIYKKFMDADGEYTEKWICMKAYLMSGYPTETKADYDDFRDIIQRLAADVQHSKYFFTIQNTPLRCQALTPLGYEAVDLTDFRDYLKREKNKFELRTENVMTRVSFAVNAAITVLQAMILARGEIEDGELLRFMVSNKRFGGARSMHQIEWLKKNYERFNEFVRQYEIGSPIAWDYLHSYVKRESLLRFAKRFRESVGLA